jgi:anti-sigma28 factor (negative regulator of flagellin synthesis)
MINDVSGVANSNTRIQIQGPEIRNSDQERLWQDVLKYSKLIPFEPDPNMGRVQEIREEIMKGTYQVSDKIEETAARLAIRFMKSE